MRQGQFLYLSRADVVAVNIPMRDIIDALLPAFRLKGDGRVEMPPKIGIHPAPDAFLHAMPAFIGDLRSVGVKWVSGYPQNPVRGLPYINGLLILNDPETGIPVAVMDCTWITGMRTGAASAVAAKYLARPDSRMVGILGCGLQGRTNLLAIQELFPLEAAYAYDIVAEAAERYAAEMSSRTGLKVEVVREPRHAVEGMDIVVTSGPILRRPHATIRAGWLKPGAFASPVDFDSYFAPEALRQATKFCTDDIEQLRYYQRVGYFQRIPGVYADLGEIVSGRKPGRQTPDEIIICANLGLALEDMAVAPLVYQEAIRKGIGTWLPL